MSPRELLLIAGMAGAVYLPKMLPLVLLSERLTSGLRGWLQYLAPALLGALVGPSIAAPSGRLTVPGWQQAGYLVAFLVVLVTRRMILALVAGFAVVVIATLLESNFSP